MQNLFFENLKKDLIATIDVSSKGFLILIVVIAHIYV